MSVREDERNKNCPSRGLGIAAAAIGVGVGAALYYFFNRRSENPANDGATPSEWECESPHVLHYHEHDSSYTTISEHSTSDTSILDTSNLSELEHSSHRTLNFDRSSDTLSSDELEHSSHRTLNFDRSSDTLSSDELEHSSHRTVNIDQSSDSLSSEELEHSSHRTVNVVRSSDSLSSEELEYSWQDRTDRLYDSLSSSEEESDMFTELPEGIILTEASDVSSVTPNIGSDLDSNPEWDVTSSASGVPETRARSPVMMLMSGLTASWLGWERGSWRSPVARATPLREQAFRERSWSLEECTICFDVMLQNQEVMSLACAHRFHQACIMPWLEQKQTCPNCRKAS